jgi:hypothetical protein
MDNRRSRGLPTQPLSFFALLGHPDSSQELQAGNVDLMTIKSAVVKPQLRHRHYSEKMGVKSKGRVAQIDLKKKVQKWR